MPMGTKLTNALARAAKPPVKGGRRLVRDAGCTGLYLQIRKGGGRSWLQVINVEGKRKEYGHGSFPEVSVEEARTKTYAIRAQVLEGRAPAARGGPARRGRPGPVGTPTFAAAAAQTIAVGNHSVRVAQDWRNTLRTYAAPIADMPVSSITRQDVLTVLRPVWTVKAPLARRLRQRISAVMQWSIAGGFRDDDPADSALLKALGPQDCTVEHRAALHHADAPKALAAFRAADAAEPVRLALEFTVQTGNRVSACAGALWSEIDLDAAVWTVPAARMKMGRDFRVPLSSGALDVLARARAISDSSDTVFPHVEGRPATDQAIRKALYAAGYKGRCTVHGFRTTLAEWLKECTDADAELRKVIRSHAKEDAVQAAYERSDMLEQRRPYMEQWSNYLK